MNNSKPQQNFLEKQGKLLAKLREERNFSRERLCKDTDASSHFCTSKHLYEIELGKSSPGTYILNSLLAKFGVSIGDFFEMLSGADIRKFNSHFEEVWTLGIGANFVEMRVQLGLLEQQEYCVLDNPAIKQAVSMCHGVLSRHSDLR